MPVEKYFIAIEKKCEAWKVVQNTDFCTIHVSLMFIFKERHILRNKECEFHKAIGIFKK